MPAPAQQRKDVVEYRNERSAADLDGESLIRIEVGRSVVRVASSREDGG